MINMAAPREETTAWNDGDAGGPETEIVEPPTAHADPHLAWAAAEDEAPPPPRRTTVDVLRAVIPAAASAVIGAAAAVLVMHYTTPPQPPRPAAAAATITLKPPPPPTPDQDFIAAISRDGITDNGIPSVRNSFMQHAHYACFALLPPGPQQFEAVVANILTTENHNVDLGFVGPRFTYADAEHLVRDAIAAYCPEYKTA